MLTRREMLATTAGGFIARPAYALLQPPAAADLLTEQQKGDPDLTYQDVTYDPAAIAALSSDQSGVGNRAVFSAWRKTLPQEMLELARSYEDQSLHTHQQSVAEFLGLFDIADTNTAFCAAAVSYCALRAYANVAQPGYAATQRLETLRTLAPDLEHYYFYPTVSCQDMWHLALGKGRFIRPVKTGTIIVPRPGWIVLFDWHGRNLPDHCGIVDSFPQDPKAHFFTMEFNTSKEGTTGSQRTGGYIDVRKRYYNKTLFGYIRTDSDPNKREYGRIG